MLRVDKVLAGAGRIVLQSNGSEAILAELSAAYPLKLVAPRINQGKVALVYMLSYGGGLVAGDYITLSAIVQDGTVLVLLTQGSTKVFKTRPGQRSARVQVIPSTDDTTAQRMEVTISPDSALFLLPDPVTCFRAAKYRQIQTLRIVGNGSAVLLDWITSGRKSLGEEWVFSRYYSLNELWVDDKRIMRDAMLLEENQNGVRGLPARTLGDRMGPYACYATVLMFGPLTDTARQCLRQQYEKMTVFKRSTPPDLLWSLSDVCGGRGSVLRVAARETEDVRKWLYQALRPLEDVVGGDNYNRALG